MKEITGFWDTWYIWLKDQTIGFDVAVEFGSGFFDKLASVTCPVKIGIEAFKPYIDNAKYNDCIKIHGNMLDYRSFNIPTGKRVAIFIDALEHLEKNEALKLISEVKDDFDKIVLMIPNGNMKQNKDVTGFGNHEGQTHKSFWFGDDLEEMGFDVLVDNNFHKEMVDKQAYFATWER